jgi:alkanesulfonate monooxygenase SsuD/methylene tetrahydromethanopterin reductase-like flavin-dependent oxidoreductase (luciferase family)
MSFDTIVERTLAAEASGFDSLWLMDHLAAPRAPEIDTFEGWTLAAALAARTSRIRIGHLTTCDPFRHPVVLAKMAATIDVCSHGRLELGIGWGSVEEELAMFGFGPDPRPERAARLAESLHVVKAMFTGEPFDHHGRHFHLDGAQGRPVPVQDPVPVHIGGGGPRLTMPIVREHADWWNCPLYAYDRFEELRPLAGDARVSLQRAVGLAANDAERDVVRATTEKRFGGWGELAAGTAPEIADVLARDMERGIEGFVIQLHDFGRPETVERFMGEVVPELT